MNNFTYHNPVKIIFGKAAVDKLPTLLSKDRKIMLAYGMGSIKKTGLYDKILKTLEGYKVVEFAGIEANPDYATCMKAIALAKTEGVDFILSVGGGSVLDAVKFIAAGVNYDGDDPWELLTEKKSIKVKSALPIGCILTLAATGSEGNGFSVISRRETGEKLAFGSPLLYPLFSILDPQLTFTLNKTQTVNGIVDAFVHVFEQYCTYDVNSPLQDRQSEAILKTLIEEGPKVINDPENYEARANVMWCATHALNGMSSCGIVQDWSTHMIGHELTAIYGLDHARSLAAILPALIEYKKNKKFDKFVQYGKRVWHSVQGDDETIFNKSMEKTLKFFESLEMPTRLSAYDITNEKFGEIGQRFEDRNMKIGERQDIGKNEVIEILNKAL
ncbi:MAG: iron-containing alcohol dehydrogenase [Leptospirales bacterium]